MIWIIGIELIIIIYLIIEDRKMADAFGKLQEYATRLEVANTSLEAKMLLINEQLANSVSEAEIISVLETPVSNIEAKINEINPEQ